MGRWRWVMALGHGVGSWQGRPRGTDGVGSFAEAENAPPHLPPPLPSPPLSPLSPLSTGSIMAAAAPRRDFFGVGWSEVGVGWSSVGWRWVKDRASPVVGMALGRATPGGVGPPVGSDGPNQAGHRASGRSPGVGNNTGVSQSRRQSA
jgi:hypothetical protein